MARIAGRTSGLTLDVVARVAGAATSGGSTAERSDEILHELQRVFPFDAGMVLYVDPATSKATPIVVRGYPDDLREYMRSPAWHQELVEPFGMPRSGWPVRERDLPVDPETIPSIGVYGRGAGLMEGMLSALCTCDGQYVGFLILSWSKKESPPDYACEVVGHVAPALANMVDPLQSARTLAAMIGEEHAAVGIVADGITTFRGGGDPLAQLIAEHAPVRRMVDEMLAGPRRSVAFLWPNENGGWYGCRAFECKDGRAVLTVRELGSLHGLTRRELEVLTYLADGRSNVEIAGELWVTQRTVRAHVEHILEKLEVPTRSAAVARAVGEGLLLPRDPDKLASD